jgi:hypothetical protein
MHNVPHLTMPHEKPCLTARPATSHSPTLQLKKAHHMGKQYNKVIKRRRHKAYLARRKAADKARASVR